MTSSFALCLDTPGPTSHLQWREIPLPPLGENDVLIRHEAIGLNYIDVYHRTGLYPLPLPAVLGVEGAGVVEAVGSQVQHLRVGDKAAYACLPPGAYSQRRVMPAMAVCQLPSTLSTRTAAASLLKGLTAYYLLHRVRPPQGLQPGDFILVHAAAGGVGLILCQWAKALGFQVIATAGSAEKCAKALAHGAAYALNYSQDDIPAQVKAITQGQGVKVVYDSVGQATWDASLNSLAPFGLLASFGSASGPIPPFAPALLGAKGSLYLTRQSLFNYLTSREQIQTMADAVFNALEKGHIQAHIGQEYALQHAAKAHERLEARDTIGASVLIP